MSPEYQSGHWEVVRPTSDVHSLGATLYYLLTGNPPYTGESWAEVLRRMDEGLLTPPRHLNPSIPKSLGAVCLKALAPKPGDRYSTAAQLAQEIERSLADEPVSACAEPCGFGHVASWTGIAHRLLHYSHRFLLASRPLP